MSLYIVLGGPNSDKTLYCFEEMQKRAGSEICMIVPDQFSYAAEKNAIRLLGGTGLNGIEVLTFNRIVYRIRQKIIQPDYITASGREMLVCRAIKEVIGEDSIFFGCIDKDGFVAVISGLISEFKRYSITPEILAEQCTRASNKALEDKLTDISKIYNRYEELIGDNFSDSDNDLDAAAEYIRTSGMFKGQTVFFDGFSDFLPQNMNVVEEIIKNADDVYITLCIPENVRINDDTFDTCRKTYSSVKRIARECGADTHDIMLGDTKKRSDGINFLINNWNGIGAKYDKETEDIDIFYAKNPYSEVERAAARIVKCVREEGLRFRDIAVLCGDMSTYGKIVQSTFGEYDIPYFTDETTPISDHPVITGITAVFDILENDWRYDDVFRYLRAGFVYDSNNMPIERTKIDKLENYVLRWGVRGKKQWLSDKAWRKKRGDIFGTDESEEIDEEMDLLRNMITAPIENFRQKASGKNAQEKAAALFEFLEEIHMPDGIENEVNVLRAKGFMDEAAQFEKVWELLIEAIEQVYTVIGAQRCSMSDFARYIIAGLSKCDIRIIPSSLDHVAVGTIDRSRNADAKHLFILGANYGKIPPDMTKEGILSNRDREELSEKLAEYNLSVAPDTKKRDTAERYKVYRSLCSAYEGLHISYSASGVNDDTLRPSQFVVDITRMFPKIKKSDDMIVPVDNIESVKSAFRMLMLHFDDCGGAWGEIRRYFEENEEYKPKIDHVLNSCRANAGITAENAKRLFASDERSVSQFEKYASCPYSYFLSYGLRLHERDVWEINKINIGNLCHRIVQKYCERVSEGLSTLSEIHSRWHHMSDEESTRIITSIIDEETAVGLKNAVYGKGRMRSVMNRIRRVVYTSVNTINQSLSKGDFVYSASEKGFSQEIGGVRVRGAIDRVDIAETDGKAYIRVVDYKSGKQSFDLKKIAAGLNLQLVTYAIAARNLYLENSFSPRQSHFADVRIGGILYNKIRDDIVSESDAETALKKRDQNRKMSGRVFVDDMDGFDIKQPNVVSMMDSTLKAGEISEFLPVSITAKGGINMRSTACASSEEAVLLMRHTKKCIGKAQSDILSGNIPISPYSMGGFAPCEYCEYMQVCKFDNKVHSYRNINLTQDDIARILNGETDI